MNPVAQRWYQRHTTSSREWPLERVLSLKGSTRVAVVFPARDVLVTVGVVVGEITLVLHDLVDELFVMDSLSSDTRAT
ncbi:MAG: hypothetical protein Q8Q44_25675, partial [Nocardioides sp.]|nr:hypothetical protein [Nocardioides sp.]